MKMVAPMASIINMDLINIWKKSEKNFEQNRPESSLQVVLGEQGPAPPKNRVVARAQLTSGRHQGAAHHVRA